jgi:hypothetical protein
MDLGLYRREHLHSGNAELIGAAVVEQFQRTHGAITAWQEVEHHGDGSHGAIHAESLTLTGGIYRPGSAVAMGTWQDESYVPAKFTATAPLTFVPTLAQVQTNRYTRVGQTLIWHLSIDGAVIGGSGTGTLQLRLPGGSRAGGYGRPFPMATAQTDALAAGTPVVAYALAGGDTLTVLPLPPFAFAPTTGLNLWALVTMEIL